MGGEEQPRSDPRGMGGPALYELLCRDCGRLTVGVTDLDGCVDLVGALACGHDLSSREVAFYRQEPA